MWIGTLIPVIATPETPRPEVSARVAAPAFWRFLEPRFADMRWARVLGRTIPALCMGLQGPSSEVAAAGGAADRMAFQASGGRRAVTHRDHAVGGATMWLAAAARTIGAARQ